MAGVLLGMVGGVMLGNAVRNHDLESGGLLLSNFPHHVVGGAVGLVVGELTGAIVGKIEVTAWEPVT